MRSKRKRMKRRRRDRSGKMRWRRRRSKLGPSASLPTFQILPCLLCLSDRNVGDPLAVRPLEPSEHLSKSPVTFIKGGYCGRETAEHGRFGDD